MKIRLRPCDFPVPLATCPPGFFHVGNPDDKNPKVGFKSQVDEGGKIQAFLSDGTEFWGSAKSEAGRKKLEVTPLKIVIEKDDDE
jgi:hypothetical protein